MEPEWTRLREIHRSMMKRCYNPRCKDYPHYGGRGVRVCDEWHDFERFYDWAMSSGYSNELTLDRRYNNKGYRPDNCRWISRHAQANNRSTATFYTVDGRTRSLAQWCREYGIPSYTVCHRLEAGWSVKDAITTPVGVARSAAPVEEDQCDEDYGHSTDHDQK